jgi:predicted TIM-barrel fold metal-dependent hydrolase
MIIDAHVHIGRSISPWLSQDMVADQIAAAHAYGIDRLCISCLGDTGFLQYPSPEELRVANDYVLEAMARFPDTILGYCFASPQYPQESVAEIRRCVREGPMVAIKLWVARKASDPGVDAILEEAAELGVPVLQHAWYKTMGNMPDESTPADVAIMAQRHPNALIQMAHLNGANERGVQDIAPYPNIIVDTSGGEPETGLIEYTVQMLGAERVVFGSDAPGRDFSVQLGKVTGANLTENELALILGGNMARLLKLEG